MGESRKYPKSFYKFTQKLLHSEFFRLFKGINGYIDRFGTEVYQKSLKEYLSSAVQLDMFGLKASLFFIQFKNQLGLRPEQLDRFVL